MSADETSSFSEGNLPLALSALLSGTIVDKYLPGTESTLSLRYARDRPFHLAGLTSDCGTFPLGCPPITQDPAACPTVDVSLPSCGLCPDTNPPPAGHCHLGETDHCGGFTDNCPPNTHVDDGCGPPPPPPNTSVHCEPPPPPPPPPWTTTDSGCSPETGDCEPFTHPCANTSTDCQTPATVDSSCTSHETSACANTTSDCETPATVDPSCTSQETTFCPDTSFDNCSADTQGDILCKLAPPY